MLFRSSFGWLLAPNVGFAAMMKAGLGALCIAGLTLFFFVQGAGGFDKYVVDGAVNGVGSLTGFFGALLRKTQSGRVQTYIIFALLGVMILFFAFR